MKLRAILLAMLALALSGCDERSVIQQVLDRELPPTFQGRGHVEHKNVWFDVTIDATGLHREADGWHWSSLTYRRNGRASYGIVTLEPNQ